jgi:hypothetical protein
VAIVLVVLPEPHVDFVVVGVAKDTVALAGARLDTLPAVDETILILQSEI